MNRSRGFCRRDRATLLALNAQPFSAAGRTFAIWPGLATAGTGGMLEARFRHAHDPVRNLIGLLFKGIAGFVDGELGLDGEFEGSKGLSTQGALPGRDCRGACVGGRGSGFGCGCLACGTFRFVNVHFSLRSYRIKTATMGDGSIGATVSCRRVPPRPPEAKAIRLQNNAP
jgi:hypothetical protein